MECRNLSKSDAIRVLIQAGLHATKTPAHTRLVQEATLAFAVSALVVGFAFPIPIATVPLGTLLAAALALFATLYTQGRLPLPDRIARGEVE